MEEEVAFQRWEPHHLVAPAASILIHVPSFSLQNLSIPIPVGRGCTVNSCSGVEAICDLTIQSEAQVGAGISTRAHAGHAELHPTPASSGLESTF